MEYQDSFIRLFSVLDIEKSLFVCWSDLKKLELNENGSISNMKNKLATIIYLTLIPKIYFRRV